MLLPLSALLSALLALIRVCSAEDIPVISGVFMPRNITVDYEGAKAACALQYSRLATLQEITVAYKNGYEYCQWGWTEEKRIAMLRLTPFLPCARHNLGILIRDCPNIRAAWCAATNDTGTVTVSGATIPWGQVPSYENATLTCRSQALSLATYEQIQEAGSALTEGFAWYDSGVGQILNESRSISFKSHVCNDTASTASAFCYNPSLADHIIVDNTQTVKKIIIACLLASIFVLLLCAAFCMKGNKFICCMEKQQPQSPVVQAPLPNWNMASIYRRTSQAHREVEYGKVISSEMRPPAIRPEMSHYRTHYTNMGYEATGDD
ncbi:uncharacterized protein [Hyperolius riggenbachi]|uniref:uncharacterized protein n=1 Tax=Hyperolius riggenbachi TaxID=752182 RepID=UPI0035A3713A